MLLWVRNARTLTLRGREVLSKGGMALEGVNDNELHESEIALERLRQSFESRF